MKKYLIAIFSVFYFLNLHAQEESMLAEIEDDEEKTEYVSAAFKTNRIVNSHSLENTPAGVLDFKIGHRFGFINSGVYEMFGLDNAQVRIGLDYGINDRFQVGVGRSTFQKTYDGYFKAKLLKQSKGARNVPVSISYVAAASVNTLRTDILASGLEGFENHHRLSYVHQLIAGSKITKRLSLQAMPTLVHRNLVETRDLENSVFAAGAGGRFKVSKHVAVTGEYYYVIPDQIDDERYTNSVSIGVDIETGGHVFQLHVTNSTPMFENGFITRTTGDPFNGDIHFGFNISRVFTVVKPEKFRNKAQDASSDSDW